MRTSSTPQIGALQWGIILLAAATGLIHLLLLNYLLLNTPGFGQISIPFTLNGIGFIVLAGALYLPLPWAKDNRGLVRWMLIGFSALTIVAWIFMGQPYTPLGYITKLIELALIVLLWLDSRN
jgi:hypothetical protein